ncbi:MAG: hypothetical protein FDZ75_08590, partial [Actinobacteria bacterium]
MQTTLTPFEGRLSRHFAASDPIKVYGWSAAKLVIQAPRDVTAGVPFDVTATLTNTGPVDLYLVKIWLTNLYGCELIAGDMESSWRTLAPAQDAVASWTLMPYASGTLLSTNSEGNVSFDILAPEAMGRGNTIKTVDAATLEPLGGTKLLANNRVYLTKGSGRVILDEQGVHKITATRDGYRVSKMIYDLSAPSASVMLMDKWRDDGKPYVSMAAYKKSETEYKDVLHQDVRFDAGSDKRCELTCDAEWNGNGPGKYVLYQGTKTLESTTGRFTFAPGKQFRPDSRIYLKLVAANGVVSDRIQTKLVVESPGGSPGSPSLKIGNTPDIKVDKDKPVVSNLAFKPGFKYV